jgi:hypothetical protein
VSDKPNRAPVEWLEDCAKEVEQLRAENARLRHQLRGRTFVAEQPVPWAAIERIMNSVHVPARYEEDQEIIEAWLDTYRPQEAQNE